VRLLRGLSALALISDAYGREYGTIFGISTAFDKQTLWCHVHCTGPGHLKGIGYLTVLTLGQDKFSFLEGNSQNVKSHILQDRPLFKDGLVLPAS
jgi:hypothetical protein